MTGRARRAARTKQSAGGGKGVENDKDSGSDENEALASPKKVIGKQSQRKGKQTLQELLPKK